jgi:hypothetical protein
VTAASWGVLVLALGWGQQYLLEGSWHWVIRLLHLVISMASVAWGRSLAAAIHRAAIHRKELWRHGRVVTTSAG